MTATTWRRLSRWTAAGALLATATATIVVGTGVANAAALRLGLSPLLALWMAGWLQVPELTARVLILEAAMPSAVVANLAGHRV